MIAYERRRQVTEEGYKPEHDDTHEMGELASAAIAYASPFHSIKALSLISGEHEADVWPWHPSEFRPSETSGLPSLARIRDLVKAGALIAAEIDRIQRLLATSVEQPN